MLIDGSMLEVSDRKKLIGMLREFIDDLYEFASSSTDYDMIGFADAIACDIQYELNMIIESTSE